MFFLSDLVGCGNKADELKAESLEDDESMRDFTPERAAEMANKLRALKVKHSVIKKERDQLLVEKRELLTPVKEVKEDTSGYIRQIKGLEAQLKIEREKVMIQDVALMANKEIERSLEVSQEENKNLHLHLETAKELSKSRQERIEELEARSRADKTQLEVMKVKYDGGKSTDNQTIQQAINEANTSKLALKMAKEELELLRSKVVESETNVTMNQQQQISLQTRLDTMTAQKKSAELSLEMAQSELLGMQKRWMEMEQSHNSRNGTDTQSAADHAEKLRLLQQLQQQVMEHKEARAGLTKERDDLLSVKAKLEAQVTELERQLKRDRSQMAIIQQESDQIVQSAMTAARGEVGAYRDRINELKIQSRKDRERSAQIQREFDELITGRVVTDGSNPTRLADRCKAVQDKLEAASLRSKALIHGFLEQDENDQALFDENNDGLSEERRNIAELVARERSNPTATNTIPVVVSYATLSSSEH